MKPSYITQLLTMRNYLNPSRFFALFLLLNSLDMNAQTPDFLTQKQVIVGSGGGAAGIETRYLLLENGHLYEQKGINTPPVRVRILYRSTATKYFERLKKLNLATRTIDNPGNLYYFVEQFVSQKQSNKAIWGNASSPPPNDIKVFYDRFMKYLVPKSSVVSK